ncbi:hypothetical protein OK016_28870 [Vibrio chagasii]|nr:hypothetical protein [Vibrio chagasii]
MAALACLTLLLLQKRILPLWNNESKSWNRWWTRDVDDQQQAVLIAETNVPDVNCLGGVATAPPVKAVMSVTDIGTTGRSVGRLGNEANGG